MEAGAIKTPLFKPQTSLSGNNTLFPTTRLSSFGRLLYVGLTARANENPHQVNTNEYQPHASILNWSQSLASNRNTQLNCTLAGLLELEPTVAVNGIELENKNNVSEDVEEQQVELKFDASFVVPDNNAFGHSFRDYDKESERKATVEEFYRIQHLNQTYEFATKKKEEFGKLQNARMSIWECCELLNEFIDESDPDLDEPQIEHLLQTAEAIRRDYPNEDWLHLTALIHDLGKVLLHPAFSGAPQWAVVGDTFPLGCAFNEAIVHHQFFKENLDYHNPEYTTKLGIYSENCGLDNVTMSWGHDEYMYLVAKGNNTTLPPAALFIIRFHSFYALHRSNAYTYLMNEEDEEMLKWLRVFNKYDLYSKSKARVNQEEVKPYYMSLIEKYFPAKLRW